MQIGEKLHNCKELFSQAVTLKTHIRNHTGEKTYGAHNALTHVPNYLISNNTGQDIPQLTKFVYLQFAPDHNVKY